MSHQPNPVREFVAKCFRLRTRALLMGAGVIALGVVLLLLGIEGVVELEVDAHTVGGKVTNASPGALLILMGGVIAALALRTKTEATIEEDERIEQRSHGAWPARAKRSTSQRGRGRANRPAATSPKQTTKRTKARTIRIKGHRGQRGRKG